MPSLQPRFQNSFQGSKTQSYVVWRRWHTMLRKKDESWLRNWKTISFFAEISPPIAIKHTQTSANKGINHSIYGMIVSNAQWLTQLSGNSFPFSFYTPSVYSKATYFSQSPTRALILDQIQLLWKWQISCKKWKQVPKKIRWQLGDCFCLIDKTFWTTI